MARGRRPSLPHSPNETPREKRDRRNRQLREAAERREKARAARTILRLSSLLPDGTFTEDAIRQMAVAAIDETNVERVQMAQVEQRKVMKALADLERLQAKMARNTGCDEQPIDERGQNDAEDFCE